MTDGIRARVGRRLSGSGCHFLRSKKKDTKSFKCLSSLQGNDPFFGPRISRRQEKHVGSLQKQDNKQRAQTGV